MGHARPRRGTDGPFMETVMLLEQFSPGEFPAFANSVRSGLVPTGKTVDPAVLWLTVGEGASRTFARLAASPWETPPP